MREIRIYGDPVLRKRGKEIIDITPQIEALIDEMIETMRERDGVGLAANQVGEALRIVVIDPTGGEEQPLILINPEIIEKSEEMEETEEGCLSIPDISLPVKRHKYVSVKAKDRGGKVFEIKKAEGLFSRALQHEIDHINGILFIDHLSPLQRKLISGKLKKMAKGHSESE
ncbi:MAG: peptide deformylase [Chitinispirillaceae bacterium]|nr:peptide deformylase [Chitinispirillaceae bacterium]